MLLSCFAAVGQQLELSDFSTINGLPSLETYDVYQSRDGFIWIATDLGVARYDGYQLEILTAKDGLPDPVVFGFSEDEFNRIWFRTFSGKIAYYQDGKIFPYAHSEQVENATNKTLLYYIHFKNNTLSFSTARNISKIDSTGNRTDDLIPIRQLTIRIDGDKKILGGFHGLSGNVKTVDINYKLFPIQLSDSSYHNKVLNIVSKGDKIYFTINSDVFASNGNQLQKIYTGDYPIISLSLDKQGGLWVGYEKGGVDKISIKDWKATFLTNQLKGKSVSRVLQDNDGGMWFSTLEAGVLHASNPDYNYIHLPDKALAIASREDFLAIGFQNGSILVYNVKTLEVIETIGLESGIRSLFIDSKNRLWASAAGTKVYDLGTKKKVTEIGGGYTSITEEENLSSIWSVGGTNIRKIDRSSFEDQMTEKLAAIHQKILPYDSILFLSKRIGVDIFNIKNHTIRKMPELASHKISDLLHYSNHEILITTLEGGFYLFDIGSQQITHFSKEGNFVANNIYSVAKGDSMIWMSTENGVLATTLSSLKIKKPRVQTVGSWKKYPEEKIRHLLIHDDFICGVSDFGIVKIPRTKNTFLDKAPAFYYKLVLPAISQPQANTIIQLPAESDFHLKFGFISFTNQNIKTRYRLSKESSWTPLITREISLNSLSSGTHNLELQSSIDNVTWNSNLMLTLAVATPWWRAWYSIICYALAIFALAYFIFQNRIKTLHEKQSLLTLINEQREKLVKSEYETMERERARIAKDFHDSVGTDLAAMKLVVKHALQDNPESAKEIDEYFQNTIKEVRNIIQDLTPPMITQFGLMSSLSNYIHKAGSKFGKEITFDWVGEDIKDNQFATIIFRTIQELISNSIKHAQCKSISLTIHAESNSLRIHYADDGIGFNLNGNYSGLGIRSILSRVEYLKGKLDFNSTPKGAHFVIEVPRA